MRVNFLHQQLSDFSLAQKHEWLETNQLGSYASSTILNCHSRKYHGLLVAKLPQKMGKFVTLSQYEDSVSVGDKDFFLSTHTYPNAVYPESYQCLAEYRPFPSPTFVYRFGEITIYKEIVIHSHENVIFVRYRFTGFEKSAVLKIRPLLAMRNYHQLSKENLQFHVRTFPCVQGFFLSPYHDFPSIYFQTNVAVNFYPSPLWYYNIEYPEELYRGYDYHEDLFQPGLIEVQLSSANDVIISAGLFELNDPEKEFFITYKQRQDHTEDMSSDDNLRNIFILKESSHDSGITAGYHWFEQWGRDTMISLPGLLLIQKDYQSYIDVLKKFGRYERHGIIPNFVNADLDHAYNSVDASLWFAWAIQKFVEDSHDYHKVNEEFFETLSHIYHGYKNGTDYHIQMQENGLLYSGSQETALTWMDAHVDGKPVTPRHGFAVEINALWYNFICFFHDLCIKTKHIELVKELAEISKQIKISFRNMFWLEDKKYLADGNYNGMLDISVRPNQIFAVALPYSPLTKKMKIDIIKKVRQELLTPFGLRTLSPADVNYHGRYGGSQSQRDMAYHNGTIWPWLIGFYVTAIIELNDNVRKTINEIEQILHSFKEHIFEAGIGSISEIFDGDPPHQPHGCIAQAWSVAEFLRMKKMLEKLKANVAKNDNNDTVSSALIKRESSL